MAPLAAALEARLPGARVHFAELPGHGDQTADGAEGVFERAAARLFDGLAAGPRVLVLHSIASGLLPALVASSNDDLAAVFLLEGNMATDHLELSGRLASMDAVGVERYTKSLAGYGRLMMERALVASLPSVDIARYAETYRALEPSTLAALARDMVAMTQGGSLRAALVRLGGRLHCVWGSRSVAPDLSDLAATLHIVANAGHNPMLDDSDAVADIVAAAVR